MLRLNLYYVQFISGVKKLQQYQFSNKDSLLVFLKQNFKSFFFHKLTLEELIDNQYYEKDLVYSLWTGKHNFQSLGFPDLTYDLDQYYQPKPKEYFITHSGYAMYEFTDFFIQENLKKYIGFDVKNQLTINRQKFSDLKTLCLHYSGK